MMLRKHVTALILLTVYITVCSSQSNKTYCNPLNLDYGFTPIPDFSAWGKHRATADPVIVSYRNAYFLFSTNQWGYWWSMDLLSWNFVPRR